MTSASGLSLSPAPAGSMSGSWATRSKLGACAGSSTRAGFKTVWRVATGLGFWLCFLPAICAPASYTLSITFASTPETPSVQKALIAATTNQYLSTITKTPWGSDTYTINVTGVNPAYTPPVPSSPILTSTAFDQCVTLGFSLGMESERYDDIELIRGLQARDWMAGTVGGRGLIDGGEPTISTTTCHAQCMDAYVVSVSTISQRWYEVLGIQ